MSDANKNPSNMNHEEAFAILSKIRTALMTQAKQASIAIVNKDGRTLATFSMDMVRPDTANIALLKAQQSALTGKNTRELRDRVEKGELTPEVLGIKPAEFIKWAGGVPVYCSAGEFLGGVGVSNLHEDEDESFASDGIFNAGMFTVPQTKI